MTDTKNCPCCEEELPLESFGVRHKQNGYVQSWCTICRAAERKMVVRNAVKERYKLAYPKDKANRSITFMREKLKRNR